MNATVHHLPTNREPRRQALPPAAVRQLTRHLCRALATGEAYDVALAYDVDPDELARLAEYWLTDFDFEQGLAWLAQLYEAARSEFPECPLEALACALAWLG